MAYLVNWDSRIITIPQADLIWISGDIYKLDLEECHQELRRLEWVLNEGLSRVQILKYIPPLEAGGVIYARFVLLQNGYTVTFEDGQYAVNFDGANTNIHDFTNVNQVSIRPNNSAGLQDLSTLLSSAYNGEVVIDVINGQDGTSIPIGTRSKPVKTVSDARVIMAKQNVNELTPIGNIQIGLNDDVRGIHMIGASHINNTLSVESAALCLNTQFSSFDITGTLDGNSEIRDCIVRYLTYLDGHVHASSMLGRIVLSGIHLASFYDCSMHDILDPPIIDCGSSGQDVVVTNFSGRIIIDNLTGDSTIAIGMNSGDLVINSTCISGTILISGTGGLIDNSGDGCYVVNRMLDGTELNNIQTLIGLQSPHHTVSGEIWYWNPYNGNDGWDGKDEKRAFKTFAKAEETAENARHDLIVGIAGNPNGVTITNEIITTDKDFLIVRGPGRDFIIQNVDDSKDAVTITGRGVEFSGFRIGTSQTSTKRAIYSTGTFTFLNNLYIYESNDGIELNGGEYSIVSNIKSHHNAGFGIKLTGIAEHIDIENNHIGGNGGSGIVIDTNQGHEVNIKNNIIHKNNRYGIEISETSEGVLIDALTDVFGNTEGDILDNGIGTYIAKTVKDVPTATQNADTTFEKLRTTDI